MKSKTTQSTHPTLRTLFLGLAITTLAVCVARAHPYASGITNSTSDSSGTIGFYLNEAADSVYVAFPDNTTNTLGEAPTPRANTPSH